MSAADATRYFTFLVLNVIIATCGATLWAFGAILQVDEHKGIKSFAPLSIGGFAIGVGVLVFILACWGGWAAFKRKPEILVWYSILIIVIFIIQIVLGAIALGSVNHTKCESDKEMEKAVKNLFRKTDAQSLKTINKIQKTYKCCGFDGPKWWNYLHTPIPKTCCAEQTDICTEPFERGCAEVYTERIEKNVGVIGGVAIGFAITELVAAILAWYIRLAIKRSQYF